MSQIWKDRAERAVATFVQAFLAVFVVTDMSTAKSAAVAGVSAVIALLKGYAAQYVGKDESASLI